MSRTPDRSRSPGADAFLLAFDAETRRRNRASHLCADRAAPRPRLLARRARARAARGGRREPDPARADPARAVWSARRNTGSTSRRARWVRFRAARDDARPPPGDWDAPVALPELFAERLNELHPDGRAGLLRVDAVRYADGRTDLALTWLHMLFDGWGSERFVEFLGVRARARARPTRCPRPTGPARRPTSCCRRTRARRGNMAMEWQRWMRRARRLPVALARGTRARRAPGPRDRARAHAPRRQRAGSCARAARCGLPHADDLLPRRRDPRAHHAVMTRARRGAGRATSCRCR